MALLIALAAIGLFVAGVTAGIVGVVCVAIRREEKDLSLTGETTGPVTWAGRWITGVGVRNPRLPASTTASELSRPRPHHAERLPRGRRR
jgi:hypothetical protein